jgi:hypothetical protein
MKNALIIEEQLNPPVSVSVVGSSVGAGVGSVVVIVGAFNIFTELIMCSTVGSLLSNYPALLEMLDQKLCR